MKILRAIAVFLALALAANLATVAALPYLINAWVYHGLVKKAGGRNRAFHAPLPDASAREIVRPSPDLLYTACAYDVAEHPLRLTAPVPDTYLSVAGFAADSSNFFAVNDASVSAGAAGQRTLDVIVAAPGARDLPADARVFTAPSPRGLILFRMLVSDPAKLEDLRTKFQAQQVCAPL